MDKVESDGTQEESRKRPLEEKGNGINSKRSNVGGNEPLLKLLVPNYVAGALIGKGGSLMSEMKSKFGGNIRLSANKETYPGSEERVIVLTGEAKEIVDLNNHIMQKVQDGTSKQPIDESRREQVKVVLTNTAAGFLIGRGGLTIKAIHDETKAKMSISSQDQAAVSGERVLTITGSMDQRIAACQQVVEKISSDASNMANTILRYTGGSTNTSRESRMGHLSSNRQQASNTISSLSANSKFKTKVEISVQVPDDLVGPILGKQGQVIRELAQRSGAKFHFSDNIEYAEGTTHRILTITGDMKQSQTAYSLISERVEEIANQSNSRPVEAGSRYSNHSLNVGDQYSNHSVDAGNSYSNRSQDVSNQYSNFSVDVGNPYSNRSVDASNPYSNRSVDVSNPYSTHSVDVGNPYNNCSVDVGNRYNSRPVEIGYQYNKPSSVEVVGYQQSGSSNLITETMNPYNKRPVSNDQLPPYPYSYYQQP